MYVGQPDNRVDGTSIVIGRNHVDDVFNQPGVVGPGNRPIDSPSAERTRLSSEFSREGLRHGGQSSVDSLSLSLSLCHHNVQDLEGCLAGALVVFIDADHGP